MKEFLNETLVLEGNREKYFSLMKNHISDRLIKTEFKEKKKRKIFFEMPTIIRRNRNAKDFSSLDRIRIVIDGLIGDFRKDEICKKERISNATYDQFKLDFVDAFKDFSKFKELQTTLASHNKELIFNNLGSDQFEYFQKFTDITTYDSLVVPKEKDLFNYNSEFLKIRNLVLLEKMNNFRQINKKFEDANDKLPMGGLLMGSFETFNSRIKSNFLGNVPVLNKLCAAISFFTHRVCPKLPYVKKAYFFFTKGKNRLLSKAEALGRLVSCGFDILDYKEIDGIKYFVSIKIKEPSFDMNPSYGPLFRMKRVGENGKIIGFYKLRTMHPYSEYLQEYVYSKNGSSNGDKINNDFRITPWGKIARKLWLDELPMLLNLIIGDIKLIGVRPLSLAKYNLYSEELKELRIKTKPGLLPPFYADMPNSLEELMESEKKYLVQYFKSPFRTDLKYLKLIFINIFIKGRRSA